MEYLSWTRCRSCCARSAQRLGSGDDDLRGTLFTFEGDQQTIYSTRANTAFDLDGGDGPELPSVAGLVIQETFQLLTGHLAADHLLANLYDLVLVQP